MFIPQPEKRRELIPQGGGEEGKERGVRRKADEGWKRRAATQSRPRTLKDQRRVYFQAPSAPVCVNLQRSDRPEQEIKKHPVNLKTCFPLVAVRRSSLFIVQTSGSSLWNTVRRRGFWTGSESLSASLCSKILFNFPQDELNFIRRLFKHTAAFEQTFLFLHSNVPRIHFKERRRRCAATIET